MKTERKEKNDLILDEVECKYKGFVIHKCRDYYYDNGYIEVIITYRVMLGPSDVRYYSSIESAKGAITKRIKKIFK